MDDQLEIDTTPSSPNDQSLKQNSVENNLASQELNSQGISMENASYIESNIDVKDNSIITNGDNEETPRLFSEDSDIKVEEKDPENEKLFEHNSSDEEEFEIPAFLRKHKF